MKSYNENLYVGSTRDASCPRTLSVFVNKLRSMGRFSGQRLLDVGCGQGSFTRALATDFSEVHGIDVQDEYLRQFQRAVEGESKFVVTNMSASAMTFPSDYFDTIVTIETLEHVPDLEGAAAEICRVLKPGGELLVTVPNRWFFFENHGLRVGRRVWHGRVPLLTYLPWLHRRCSLARVFKISDLDKLFVAHDLRRACVDYLWPTFEHGGNRFQHQLKPLFGLMRTLERSPIRVFGTSVVARYVKPQVG